MEMCRKNPAEGEKGLKEKTKLIVRRALEYALAAVRWIPVAMLIGLICGARRV